MNCKEARSYLGPYLDSQLGHTKTFEVSEHLRVCADCHERFAAERRVERLIVDRLSKEMMPVELWTRLSRVVEVRAPVSMSHRRHHRLRTISLAASLVLATSLGVAYYVSRFLSATPWVVSTLLAETSGNEPFVPTTRQSGVISDAHIVEAFGQRLSLGEIGASSGHDPRIIDRRAVIDRDGRTYIEIRLNCCGKPILMVLAKQEDGRMPSSFDGAAVVNDGTTTLVKGVNVAGKKLGDVMVLVASRHPVRQFVDGLRIEKS